MEGRKYAADYTGKLMPKILLIGGSDGSCGAGVFADFETIKSLNSDANVVVTSVTSQNDHQFEHSLAIPPANIKSQLDVIAADSCQAVKVGMLPNNESVEIVSKYFSSDRFSRVILDPVMASSSGASLSSRESFDALKQTLFPKVDLITPNLMEARLILGLKKSHENDLVEIAKDCLSFGSKAVLLKGGHLEGNTCIDVFVEKDKPSKPLVFKHKRLPNGTSVRGTGCRLASAIAHFYGSGNELGEAVSRGIDFLQNYLKAKLEIK